MIFELKRMPFSVECVLPVTCITGSDTKDLLTRRVSVGESDQGVTLSLWYDGMVIVTTSFAESHLCFV